MATPRYTSVIPDRRKRGDTPDYRDLRKNVVSQYAVHWEAIAFELGLEHYRIANISENYHRKIEQRCEAMLKKWLDNGISPTWGTLDDAIYKTMNQHDTPDCTPITVDPTIRVIEEGLSTDLKSHYIAQRASLEEHTWPREQPKEYTALAMIHQKNQPNQNQVTLFAKAKVAGEVENIIAATGNQPTPNEANGTQGCTEYLQESKSTQEIADILAPLEDPNVNLPQTVLIEGAPGLGKSMLLKQIAYEWAKNKQLTKSKFVFLLLLRDPDVRALSSVLGLFNYFCTKSPDVCKLCADQLSEKRGKGVTFLLDGYDELPPRDREDSFISKIISRKCKELLYSAVVISSRPHSSAGLRSSASCLVDILGFTKDNQLRFFQNALKDCPGKLQILQRHLDDHPIIRSHCYIPFNITVILWLFKEGIPLPNNSTELCRYLICYTIRRYLAKERVDIPVDNITDLDRLPQAYKKILQQLSVLCLKALETNDFVFSWQDIESACPGIDEYPNAFGLLQTVEHYSHDPDLMGAPTKTLNFIHVSVQEYLAAYQITCLPPQKELQFIKKSFFSKVYSNTFALYVGMTKGQRPCFKKFLSCYGKNFLASLFNTKTDKITGKFIEDNMASLILFQCFYEASNEKLCKSISKKMHSTGTIDLSHSGTLFPCDIRCLTLFLSKTSTKQWKVLDFSNCLIGDDGLRMLHESLTTSDVTIDKISLDKNSLTSQSAEIIIEIATSCKTKELHIPSNALTDGLDLSNNSTLEELYVYYNKISNTGASRLFTTLANNKTTRLKVLKLYGNSIGDETVNDITQFLAEKNCLEQLSLLSNCFSVQGVVKILKSLHGNRALKELIIGNHDKNPEIMAEIERLESNRPQLGIY